MTVNERIRQSSVSAGRTDVGGGLEQEGLRMRFALDRMIHRLTGWHLIEPCICARCQLRRVSSP